jgi:hypothetical protein
MLNNDSPFTVYLFPLAAGWILDSDYWLLEPVIQRQ